MEEGNSSVQVEEEKRIFEELLKQLKDEDWKVREAAIDDLREFLEFETISIVETILQERFQIGIPEYLKNLVNQEKRREVRLELYETLVNYVVKEEIDVEKEGFVFEDLLLRLDRLEDDEEEERERISKALVDLVEREDFVFEDLLFLLKRTTEERDIREQVIKEFVKLGDKRVVDPLLEILEESWEDIDVRHDAAEALGELGYKEAVEPLIKLIQKRDNEIVEEVAEALVKLQDQQAVEPLIELLEDRAWESYDSIHHYDQRESIVRALGDYKDARAVKSLANLLNQNIDDDIRFYIVVALDKIGNKKAIQPLKQALEEEDDEEIRDAIIGTLEELEKKN